MTGEILVAVGAAIVFALGGYYAGAARCAAGRSGTGRHSSASSWSTQRP